MYVGINTNFSPNKYQNKLLMLATRAVPNILVFICHVTHDQIQKSLEM